MRFKVLSGRAALPFALVVSLAAHAALLRFVTLRTAEPASGHLAYLVTFEAGTPEGAEVPRSEETSAPERAYEQAPSAKEVPESDEPEPGTNTLGLLKSEPVRGPAERGGPNAEALELTGQTDANRPEPVREAATGKGKRPEAAPDAGSLTAVGRETEAGAAPGGTAQGATVKDNEAPPPERVSTPERAPRHPEANAARRDAAFDDELNRRIEKKKVYPPGARRQGIQGTVLCVLEVGPTGALAGIEVVKSSGSTILDDAAVDLLRRVFPIPNPAGKPITLEKAIRYSLVD